MDIICALVNKAQWIMQYCTNANTSYSINFPLTVTTILWANATAFQEPNSSTTAWITVLNNDSCQAACSIGQTNLFVWSISR